jgi:hypothetical protein
MMYLTVCVDTINVMIIVSIMMIIHAVNGIVRTGDDCALIDHLSTSIPFVLHCIGYADLTCHIPSLGTPKQYHSRLFDRCRCTLNILFARVTTFICM